MSQVIYARVPDSVKGDVEEYADQRSLSLSSSVVDLLQRGLAAAGEERSIANLEGKLVKLDGEKNALEAKLSAVTNEVERCDRSFREQVRPPWVYVRGVNLRYRA